MFVLVGIKNDVSQDTITGPFVNHYEKKYLATFDTEQMAQDYINKSMLPKPIKRSFSSKEVFKSQSLLRNCEYADIETWNGTPHNPVPPSTAIKCK